MIQLIEFMQKESGNLALVQDCITQVIAGNIRLPQRMRIRVQDQTVEQAEQRIANWRQARFCYVLDHKPIITDKFQAAIRAGRITIEDIILDQRLREPDNTWYIDDYGFYLYATPIISLTGADVNEDRTETGILSSLTEKNIACKSKLI